MKDKPDKPFELPTQLTNQLSECSMSWLLFIINDKGEIVPYMDVSTEANGKALLSYASEFSDALKTTSIKAIQESFNDAIDKSMEDFDNDDEEGQE